ncbi:modifier of protein aggregation 4 isoform X1 [Oratosquilla oratoria]|uniref:modifier of protein aggregation 4 isoform X1 n=1 Tax=Oratosquilla oratoria TaxID=337810 RepID=UPI003F76E444
MTNIRLNRGNQRELARQKNAKKQAETNKKKGADNKDGNKGMNLEQRKQRDAEMMRLKQQKAAEKKSGDAKSG